MSVEPPEALPPFSMQRLPITYAIPYNFRWRINEMKLMMNDLQELTKKHEIRYAQDLYATVQNQCEALFKELNDKILAKQAWRKKLEANGKNHKKVV